MKGKIRKITGILALAGCVAAFAPGTSNVYANEKDEVICEGIYIGSLDVGGMTRKKATKKLEKYVNEAKTEKVTVNIDEEKVSTTLGQLGYSCDVNSFVQEAYNYGKTGDVIKRYKERKDVEKTDVVYDLYFALDTDKVQEFVDTRCTVFDKKAKDAALKRVQGEFKIEEASNGREIVADETAEKIEKVIASQWITGGIQVDAIMNDTTPMYDSRCLQECTTKLGSYSTSFASSGSSRSQNLVNAARLLNGYTIYPGEVFSVAEHLVPFTLENGYQTASAYQNGQVVDSVGGGVCQAATTLYNALLHAEMEIVERYNHSMIVGYVKPSMDAAISEGYKDLKFKNNTDTPIYLEAYTANRSIYFNVYGKEYRDTQNRKVEYVSEVLETISPGEDKVTIDPNQPEGYERVTQSAHVGYKAKLWKIVYVNGEQVSKEQVNYSYYAPEPRYVIKGGKKPEATGTPEPSKKPNKPGNDGNKPDKTQPTKAPVKTPEPSKATPEPPKATPEPVTPTREPVQEEAIPEIQE